MDFSYGFQTMLSTTLTSFISLTTKKKKRLNWGFNSNLSEFSVPVGTCSVALF